MQAKILIINFDSLQSQLSPNTDITTVTQMNLRLVDNKILLTMPMYGRRVVKGGTGCNCLIQ